MDSTMSIKELRHELEQWDQGQGQDQDQDQGRAMKYAEVGQSKSARNHTPGRQP